MTTSDQKQGNAAILDTAGLARLADELIQHIQRGEAIDPGLLAERYPEHAEKLRELLPAIEALADLSRSGGVQVPLAGERSAEGAAEGSGGQWMLGDFRILGQIGRGGMGIVYEAEQLSLRRRVALKTLPFAGVLDQRQLARFKNESLAAAAIAHPNIVPVYAVGCERGIHFYAMQFVSGRNLAELISERRVREGLAEQAEPASSHSQGSPAAQRRDTAEVEGGNGRGSTLSAGKGSSTQPTRKERLVYYREVARLGREVAEALAHAHAEGVIHRDIKPSNLLLDDAGKIWITDFGLAQTRGDGGLTMTGDLVGTLRYMSPEQALGKRAPIDHRTDVYSLGATLYELFTLRPLLHGADREELLRQIAFDEPAPLRKDCPDVPLDLETIVLKSTAKDPRERYDTAQSLADDLGRYLDNSPILARRPTIRQHVGRWCQRHTSAVAAAVLVAIACAVFGAGSWWWITSERIKQQAESLAKVSKALAETRLQKTKAEAATKAEKAARERAQIRYQQVERGADLVYSIFADLDIDAVREATEPLEAILARRLVKLAESLEGDSIGDPLMVAVIQNQLGKSLRTLGYPRQATDLIKKAGVTFSTQLGVNDRETLLCKGNLAAAYHDAGELDISLSLLEETVDQMRANFGVANDDTLQCMVSLGRCYETAGRLAQSEAQLQEALSLIEAKHGRDSELTLDCLGHLALTFNVAGKFDKALPLREELLRRNQARYGADHLETLTAINNLAMSHYYLGHVEEAVPALEELHKRLRVKHGGDHDLTLRSMINLGLAYEASGEMQRAIPLWEEAFRTLSTAFGPGHPQTVNAANCLADGYLKSDQLDKGKSLLEGVLPEARENLGSDHPHILRITACLGSLYRESGQFEKALPLFEDGLRLSTDKLGPKDATTLSFMENLAKAYVDMKQFDKALPLYEEALQLWTETLGPDHSATLMTTNNLAVAYDKAGQLAKAAQLLEQRLPRLMANSGPDHPDKLDALGNLFTFYLRMGLEEKAKPLMAEYFERGRHRPLAPNDGLRASIMALAALRLNHFPEAEEYARACLATREKTQPDDWSTFNAKSLLGGALLGQKKYAEAEPLLLAGYEGMKQRKERMSPQASIRIPEAIDRLIQLYGETDQLDEVKKWQAERSKLVTAPAPAPPGEANREAQADGK